MLEARLLEEKLAALYRSGKIVEESSLAVVRRR